MAISLRAPIRRWTRRPRSVIGYAMACAYATLMPYRATFNRPKSSGDARYRLAVCTRVKNEGRFLPEFIAHHWLLGFEQFYLYDNNSTDEPLKVIAPFLERNIARIIPWPTVPAAPACYRHFFENFDSEAEWVAFIDTDEFIVERSDGALSTILLSRPAPTAALGINSRWFGSSSHLSIPDGLVMDAFRRCTPGLDEHIKVVVRPRMVLSYFSAHNFIYQRARLASSVSGHPIFGSFSSAGAESPVELHHYLYRSREDYLAKLSLGFADSSGFKRRPRRIEWVDTEFHKFNDVDGSWAAEKYGPRIRRLLQTFGYAAKYWRGEHGTPEPPA